MAKYLKMLCKRAKKKKKKKKTPPPIVMNIRVMSREVKRVL